MFSFIKKATVPGVTSDKDDKEKRKRDKKDRKEKQKRERASMSTEELLRLDEVRRSLKIRGRRKDKEKLPSGITADYTADFLASLERTDSPHSTITGYPSPSGHHHLNHDGYTQSDSSETSLNSLNNPHNHKNLPPLPPKPPKRGILKTPKVNVTHGDEEVVVDSNGYDMPDRNHTSLVRNTIQNELITYQNLPAQNGINGKDMGSQLLVITSTSPSADSLTDTTNSSFATPPFSLSPVGESQGFHRWSRTANFDEVNLPLPDIVPLVLPQPRILTIQRQKPPRNDFGFSLRRAMVLDRCANNGGGGGDCGDLGENMRAVIFAEPGATVQHNNETGLLPGDKLLEVNSISVNGKAREDIIDLIKASGESVTLKVQPVAELSELSRRSGHDGVDVHLDDSNIRGGTLRRSGSRRFNKTTTVCMNWTERNLTKLGGIGKIVEVDEAKFGKRKYNRGRVIEGQWLFGEIERGTKKIFLVPVPNRSGDTLIGLIKQWIEPGTKVMSDCWKAYDRLREEGFQHLTVNHSLNFVDPEEI